MSQCLVENIRWMDLREAVVNFAHIEEQVRMYLCESEFIILFFGFFVIIRKVSNTREFFDLSNFWVVVATLDSRHRADGKAE